MASRTASLCNPCNGEVACIAALTFLVAFSRAFESRLWESESIHRLACCRMNCYALRSPLHELLRNTVKISVE